jgi:hypothetical protein
MLTVELARNLLGLRERARPRADWDEVQAEYQRRSRDEAAAMASNAYVRAVEGSQASVADRRIS